MTFDKKEPAVTKIVDVEMKVDNVKPVDEISNDMNDLEIQPSQPSQQEVQRQRRKKRQLNISEDDDESQHNDVVSELEVSVKKNKRNLPS